MKRGGSDSLKELVARDDSVPPGLLEGRGQTVLGRNAALSIPTPDHYLPLLYVIAARQAGEPVTFPVEGVDGGSISMLAVQVG